MDNNNYDSDFELIEDSLYSTPLIISPKIEKLDYKINVTTPIIKKENKLYTIHDNKLFYLLTSLICSFLMIPIIVFSLLKI